MSKSKITALMPRQSEDARIAGERLERMIALLDQLDDTREAQLQLQNRDRNDRAPRDRLGNPMSIEMCDDNNFARVIQMEDWDHAAVEREDVFRRRFGFTWPLPYRQALIHLKHQRKLSDREIWWLYKSGSLSKKENGVRFAASRFMAIVGCVVIATLMLQHALVLLRVASVPVLTWKQSIVAFMLMAGIFVVQGGAYRVFVKPWRIYRRA